MNTLYQNNLPHHNGSCDLEGLEDEKNTRFKLRNFDYPKLIMLRANHCWILLVTI